MNFQVNFVIIFIEVIAKIFSVNLIKIKSDAVSILRALGCCLDAM